MTSMHDIFDIRATRKTGFAFAGLWQAAVSLYRRYRNRRQVLELADFNDNLLADIGLTRSDISDAMRGGAFDDHSRDLARVAMLRRTLSGQL